MAKIGVNDIRSQCKENGWLLLSETYKNLDEPLEFKCDEGHFIMLPWKKVRNQWICPVCKNNKYKEIEHKTVKKKKDVKRVFALDQSSRITGYSIFDGTELIDYGFFKTELEDEIRRAHQLKEWFVSMCALWKPDYIGIEGVQYQENFGITTFQTLCRVQGILLDTCLELSLQYEICPTNTWRHYCGVKGRSRVDKKRSMQTLVKDWYDISVTDDESDAIGIGRYIALAIVPKNEIINWE